MLMAVCDANYKFLTVDIGQPGSNSDGGIWDSSPFGRALDSGQVNLPESDPLPGYADGGKFPYYFAADEAFPLRSYIMRPIPGRSLDKDDKRRFNYRLSRGRRVIENAFGILTHRWTILSSTIVAEPEKASNLVRAMCVLHNFLRTAADLTYIPPGFSDSLGRDGNIIPGFWRTGPQQSAVTDRSTRGGATAEGARVRDRLVNYFSSPAGAVAWQDAHINRR